MEMELINILNDKFNQDLKKQQKLRHYKNELAKENKKYISEMRYYKKYFNNLKVKKRIIDTLLIILLLVEVLVIGESEIIQLVAAYTFTIVPFIAFKSVITNNLKNRQYKSRYNYLSRMQLNNIEQIDKLEDLIMCYDTELDDLLETITLANNLSLKKFKENANFNLEEQIEKEKQKIKKRSY